MKDKQKQETVKRSFTSRNANTNTLAKVLEFLSEFFCSQKHFRPNIKTKKFLKYNKVYFKDKILNYNSFHKMVMMLITTNSILNKLVIKLCLLFKVQGIVN